MGFYPCLCVSQSSPINHCLIIKSDLGCKSLGLPCISLPEVDLYHSCCLLHNLNLATCVCGWLWFSQLGTLLVVTELPVMLRLHPEDEIAEMPQVGSEGTWSGPFPPCCWSLGSPGCLLYGLGLSMLLLTIMSSISKLLPASLLHPL